MSRIDDALTDRERAPQMRRCLDLVLNSIKGKTTDEPILGRILAKEVSPIIGKEVGTSYVRDLINYLRRQEYPICSRAGSKNPGYYWPRNKEEGLETKRHLHNRVREEQKAAFGFNSGLDKLTAASAHPELFL